MTETKTAAHQDIAHALVAFQGEMKTVGKDKVNPHFKSRYADIASITETVMPLLSKHGLAFACLPQSADNGYEIVGVLLHESGERLEAALPLFGNDAQKIGSSITYMRRYLLCSLTGIVTGDEDDDGNFASTTNERVQRQTVSRAASTPRVDSQQIVADLLAATTKAQVRELWEKHNVGGAPQSIQDQILQHANALPEE
jgi:hypothetical protein